MKVRFFTLIAILVILIAGFLFYLKSNKDNITTDNNITAQDITVLPTQAPLPTITTAPSDPSEINTDLYPAYQTENNTKKFGYLNSTGEYIIKPSFDSAGDFHDGFAVVSMGDQSMAIDATGNIIYMSENQIGDFHNGAAVISRWPDADVLYGYIDAEGKEIISPQYKLASDFGKDNTAYVYTGEGKYALIDKTGKTVQTYEIDKKYKPLSIQDGYIIYCDSKNNYGVINLKGKILFEPKFSEISYLGNDLFALKKPDKNLNGMTNIMPAALYNAKGEQLTDFSLYDLSSFHDGYASVTDSSSTYFIGPDGNRNADLPSYEGSGTVTLFGDIVKADIDSRLMYCKKDSTVIWQEETTQPLADGIVAKEVTYKPNKYVVVHYPQIEGLADTTVQQRINTELKSLFKDSRADLKEKDLLSVEDSFIATMIKDLLIIEKDGYDYSFGAAHGMPIKDFFYIDTKTGTFYQLKDLFILDSKYAVKINDIITAQVKAQSEDKDSMYLAGSFTGITANQYFKLSESSLIIYFYPYDIAAYAAGFPEFPIPFEDIYDYIDFQGAFWNSFN